MRKLLLTFVFVAITVPAIAFEVPLVDDAKLDIYGNVKLLISYNMLNNDKIVEGTRQNGVSDNYLSYIMQPDTKFGMGFEMNRLFAKVEIGYRSLTNEAAPYLGLRLLYAGIDLGAYGRFSVGQMISTSSYALHFSDVFMGDNKLVGYGATAVMIAPAIAYSIKGFEVAVVDMYSAGTILPDNVSKTGQLLLPRIEAAYTFKWDNAFLKIFGSYANINTMYTGTDTVGVALGNGKHVAINAFHAGAFSRAEFGSFGFQIGAFASLNGDVYGTIKVANGIKLEPLRPTSLVNPADGTETAGDYAGFNNTLAFGGAFAIFNKFGEVAILELAGGAQFLSSDGIKTVGDAATNVLNFGGYLNSKFLVHPNFRITPQVGFYMRSSEAANYLSGWALVGGVQVEAIF